MRKIFVLILMLLALPVYSEVISGNVRQDEFMENKNTVVDMKTGNPIGGAKIYIPNYNIYTQTNSNGQFSLNAIIDSPSIMQIEKEGYRPFSITIGKEINSNPLKLALERSSISDIFCDGGIYHLGDNVYSQNSANCKQFKVRTMGPFYSKTFKLQNPGLKKQAFIVFGSVIGLDTKIAKELGQNSIASVYSSPVDIIFNGQKIGELNINGDNEEIPIPNSLIKQNNTLTVKTGRNLFQHKRIDYDDMEFANLRVEIRDRI